MGIGFSTAHTGAILKWWRLGKWIRIFNRPHRGNIVSMLVRTFVPLFQPPTQGQYWDSEDEPNEDYFSTAHTGAIYIYAKSLQTIIIFNRPHRGNIDSLLLQFREITFQPPTQGQYNESLRESSYTYFSTAHTGAILGIWPWAFGRQFFNRPHRGNIVYVAFFLSFVNFQPPTQGQYWNLELLE